MGSIPVGAVCLFSANSANSLFCLICGALLLLIGTVTCAKIARLVPISIYYRTMSQCSVSFSVFPDAKSPFWLAQELAAAAQVEAQRVDNMSVRELFDTVLRGKLGRLSVATYANARTTYAQFCDWLGACRTAATAAGRGVNSTSKVFSEVSGGLQSLNAVFAPLFRERKIRKIECSEI